MNRAEAYWAIWSALPHAGGAFPVVGMRICGPKTVVWASDAYTAGIARLSSTVEAGTVLLASSEATDLARFIRPGKKAHEAETLRVAVADGELHVATADDSAVFELTDTDWSIGLDNLWRQVEGIKDRLPVEYRGQVYDPDLFARFARAKRPGDVMRVYPRADMRAGLHGAAVVTVGENFLGAVSGIEYELTPDVLASWFETREAA